MELYAAPGTNEGIHPKRGGGGYFYPTSHCLFTLNNLEAIKVVNLSFSSIQEHFIRDTRNKFGILNSFLSSDIGQT